MKLTQEMKQQALDAFNGLMNSEAPLESLIIVSGTKEDPAGFAVTIGSSRNIEKALIGKMLIEPDFKDLMFQCVDSYRETKKKLHKESPELSQLQDDIARVSSKLAQGVSMEEALGDSTLEEYSERVSRATKIAEKLKDKLSLDSLLEDSGINLN